MTRTENPTERGPGGSNVPVLAFVIAGSGVFLGILAIVVAAVWIAASRPVADDARSGPSEGATGATGTRNPPSASHPAASHAETHATTADAEARLCPNGDLECVTLTVPRDQAEPDGETVAVTFAIREAVLERRGAVVTIPESGSSAISAGVPNESSIREIGESYDLVLMDPRGVGLSGRTECGGAAAEYDGAWPAADVTDITAAAQSFVTACLAEIGADRAEDLAYATTSQAVHDLEAFRRYLGDEQLHLYAQGDGSVIAQAYAVAYPHRLATLILDGPIDPTVPFEQLALDHALAAEAALEATLGHCGDGGCSSAFDQAEAIAKYDALASGLRAADLTFDFPTPTGFETRAFTLADLRSTAFASVDTETDRTLFLRAFDSANYGDPVLLERLSSVVRNRPEESSAAAHFARVCGDHTSDRDGARSPASVMAFASESGVNQLRMGARYYELLPCAYWPVAPTAPPNGDLATIEGRDFPVFILSSGVDAVAPPGHARRIFERMGKETYLVELDAGRHVTFGQGYLCVNRSVTEFLLDGALPDQPRITCPGELAGFRQGSLLPTLEQYPSRLYAFQSIDTHVYLLPEFVYWRGTRPLEVGCDQGGSMTFTDADTQVIFEFEACTFIEGLTMTGGGSLDWATSAMTFVVEVPGGHLSYHRGGPGLEDVSVEGTLNGEPVDEEL